MTPHHGVPGGGVLTPKLITLEAWIDRHYAAETAPHPKTVRRWAREGKIVPAPVKHGSRWYVQDDARYTGAPEPTDLIGRLRADYAAHAAPPIAR